MTNQNQEIEHLCTIMKVTDETSKREIAKLGFSDINDLKVLEDEDVDMLVDLTPTQRRKLKIIIKFVKITNASRIDCAKTFEKMRKYVYDNAKELSLQDINLPHCEDGQGLDKWRKKVECIIRQHGMSDLLDDKDFAEAQPKANKAFYAMLHLAVEDTPVLSFIEIVPNRNGHQAWHVLRALESNGRNAMPSTASSGENLLVDTNQNHRKRNIFNRSNGDAQSGTESDAMDQQYSNKNDDSNRQRKQLVLHGGGSSHEKDDDETLSCSDESYDEVKRNNSRKRSKSSNKKRASTRPLSKRKSSDNQNTPNDFNDNVVKQRGPSHKSCNKRNKEVNNKLSLISTEHTNSNGVLMLEDRHDNSINDDSSLEPPTEAVIQPKDSDILFNMSSISYEKHPGNYRLKRIILDNGKDTAEIIYLRIQILYPRCRFLENDVYGWDLMPKDKAIKIISSRLKYGYRGLELSSVPSQEVEIRDLPFTINENDVFIYIKSNHYYFVPRCMIYRDIISSHREANIETVLHRQTGKVKVIANAIVHKISSLDTPGSFYIQNGNEDFSWEKMTMEYSVEISTYFLFNGFDKIADSNMVDEHEPDNHKKNNDRIILNDNDVIPYAKNRDHPGTLYYYKLLASGFEETKNDTYVAVAERIMDEIKSLTPPGRFLKHAGKGEWTEQGPENARRKIQNELSNKNTRSRHKRISLLHLTV